MDFSRQEYWSGLPCLPPGDLPNSGIESKSPTLQADSLPLSYRGIVAQLVKNPLAMQETWVQSLGWEDPLEQEMVTHYSTLAWKTPWTEEPCRLQPMGWQRVGHN